jgi:Alpha-glutamyl/putrescinyl thymine pyrophosphorylase clade 3
MKWPRRQSQRQLLSNLLLKHSQITRPLLGIAKPIARDTLAMQIVASIRRDDYFRVIQTRGPIGANRADPHSDSFEAELGVAYLLQQNAFDEAAWLIFLMVYLAKPADGGWLRLRDIYGQLGDGRWDWAAVSLDPVGFEKWLAANWQAVRGKFGNHRKYESLRPDASRAMGPSVANYVRWVNAAGGHQLLFSQTVLNAGNDPHTIFDAFYHSLPVKGFGRLGRFDWVSMLSRYRFIPAEAGSAYLNTATGPKSGLRLLFTGNANANTRPKTLQQWLDDLDADLCVGMEVLEDSICNWQKKPIEFEHFKG